MPRRLRAMPHDSSVRSCDNGKRRQNAGYVNEWRAGRVRRCVTSPWTSALVATEDARTAATGMAERDTAAVGAARILIQVAAYSRCGSALAVAARRSMPAATAYADFNPSSWNP